MSDIKLFKIQKNSVQELESRSASVEKSLQIQIESNLDTFLGVQFLGSEYSTGKTHGGRIDTLGIDENGCPVIIEYKRAINENVINQGLFYLDWLLDHKAEFTLLVMEKLGKETSKNIEWSSPRLICIAKDFTKWILVANIITWPIVYYAMNYWLGNFAYRINIGIKPLVFAGIVTYVLALLTVAFHAFKAATANPVKALRHE